MAEQTQQIAANLPRSSDGVAFRRFDDARLAVFACGAATVAVAAAAQPALPAALSLVGYAGFATGLLICAARAGTLIGFGAANTVTCFRAGLAALLFGTIAAPGLILDVWWPFVLATVALLLDGVDGRIARARGAASRFGALFDQETDAALILILTALLAGSGKIGSWILAAGLLRYALLLAGRVWPRLAAPLPKSRRRSAICALTGAALAVCLAPAVDATLGHAIAAAALSALTLSFAADLIWLLATAPKRPHR